MGWSKLKITLVVILASSVSSQFLHCQPGDNGCKKCSGTCNSIAPSTLPECCEAFNVCCDEYFNQCKKCSALAQKDPFFPEYCCASFSSCCDLITTAPVAATTKRPTTKPPFIQNPQQSQILKTEQIPKQNPVADKPTPITQSSFSHNTVIGQRTVQKRPTRRRPSRRRQSAQSGQPQTPVRRRQRVRTLEPTQPAPSAQPQVNNNRRRRIRPSQ